MAAQEKAEAYVALRADQLRRMENREAAAREIRAAYIAGMEAAKADQTPTAAVARAARGNERNRIFSILFASEAEGRGELARQLAFETDATIPQARALLAVAAAQHRGLLDPRTDAFLRSALNGAGLHANSSALDLAIRSEAITPAPSRDLDARATGIQEKLDSEDRLARRAA